MKTKVVYLALAREDIDKAEDHYSEITPGLGDRFMQELEDCLAYVRQHPAGFQRVKGQFRQAPLNGFPYVVVYVPFEEEIVIFRVFNTWQNPVRRFRKK